MADTKLLEKVLSLEDKFQSLQEQLSSPEVMSDMKRYVQLNKDYKELEPIIRAGKEYEKMTRDLASAKDILVNEKDDELREMAREEVSDIESRMPQMEQDIKLLLIPAAAALVLHRNGGMGFDSTLVGIFILLYGMPNGSMPVIACESFDVDADLCSRGYALTTLLSLFTIPFVTMFV